VYTQIKLIPYRTRASDLRNLWYLWRNSFFRVSINQSISQSISQPN